MGKQKTFIPISGRWGNQIGYERNGVFYVRSAPETVNQTRATIRASKRFGRYSAKGKLIRHAFYPELDVRFDTGHINRLNSLLIRAAGDHAVTKGFRFNEQAGIDKFFTRMPELSKKGILYIPAQDIVQYNQFTVYEVKAIAVRINFNTRQVTGTDTVTMTIDPAVPFTGASIPLYVAGEGTLMLTIQVRALLKDGPSGNKQYLAADIVAVIPPPKPKRVKVHTHSQHHMVQVPLQDTAAHTDTCLPVVQRE